jgi:hypothetical protein
MATTIAAARESRIAEAPSILSECISVLVRDSRKF